MDNNTHLVSSFPYSPESALLRPAGVAGDPNLTAGLLLGYFFLGLGSYIWAFWSQRSRLIDFMESIVWVFSNHYSRLRGVQNIHIFLKGLMLNDAVNGITAVVLAIELIGSTCTSTSNCFSVFMVWFLTRYFGVLLHVLTSLVCLFFLCHPHRAAKVRCVFTLVLFLVLVLVVSCLVTSVMLSYTETIFGLGAVIFGLAVAFVAKCAMSTAPPSAAIHKKPIVIVTMVTVLFVYTPNFVTQCLLFTSANSEESTDKYLVVYANVLFFTNFNLFMDGLLFYFILRVPVEEEQQQVISLENYNPSSV